MLFPEAALGAGVFVPVAWFAGKRDDDHVGPAITVEIVGEDGEGVAVAVHTRISFGKVHRGPAFVNDVAPAFGFEPALLSQNVHFPVGGFVPNVADDDVLLAVLVDIDDADAFGAEKFIDDDFLPGDFEFRAGGRRLRVGERPRQSQRGEQGGAGQKCVQFHGKIPSR